MPSILTAEKGKVLPATDQRGPLQVWLCQLDDGRTAELSRKPESPAPTGEVTVTETQYGLRAKLVQTNHSGRGRSPEDTRRIQRQHSQEMALRYAAIQNVRGQLPDTFKVDDLKPIIDWFVRDIDA